jgi:hypothetical protein
MVGEEIVSREIKASVRDLDIHIGGLLGLECQIFARNSGLTHYMP